MRAIRCAAARLAKLEAAADGRDAVRHPQTRARRRISGQDGRRVVVRLGVGGAAAHGGEIDPTTPVLFLNTGKLFGETLRYRDRLQDVLGLTDVRTIGPHPDDRARLDPEGTLWSRNTDACCDFRKVVPVKRALQGFSAQITGRKRFQTSARAEMKPVEYFDGRFRFNPLADWTLADLEAYTNEHEIPRHPLVEDGYPSIGCMPCTRRVQSGEGYRDGRWSGLDKDECGIHIGVDGEGI